MRFLKLKIHTQILIAMMLGVAFGALFGESACKVKILGDIFINLLKMIMIPLIIASMICGVTSIGNIRNLGRMGLKTFLYYAATTILAVLVGLVLVNLIQPGVGLELSGEQVTAEPKTVIEIIREIVPDNLFNAAAKGNVLPIILFSIVFGVALSSVGEKAKPVINFFESLNAVIMRITGWIIRLAPLGVFALMAYMVGEMGFSVMKNLALYMATVLVGLAIHSVITLPVILKVVGKYSPVRFVNNMFSSVATAFSTASSAATLPVTMDCLENKAGVSNKVASFVLPIGATVNMDGTALYEAVAAMCIAQAYGFEFGIAQQLVIMFTAALASVGAAAIPSAGLVTMAIVLSAVGLPLEGVGLIIAVDRFLDMCRTAVNVWGDACGAVVVARLEGENFVET